MACADNQEIDLRELNQYTDTNGSRSSGREVDISREQKREAQIARRSGRLSNLDLFIFWILEGTGVATDRGSAAPGGDHDHEGIATATIRRNVY